MRNFVWQAVVKQGKGSTTDLDFAALLKRSRMTTERRAINSAFNSFFSKLYRERTAYSTL